MVVWMILFEIKQFMSSFFFAWSTAESRAQCEYLRIWKKEEKSWVFTHFFSSSVLLARVYAIIIIIITGNRRSLSFLWPNTKFKCKIDSSNLDAGPSVMQFDSVRKYMCAWISWTVFMMYLAAVRSEEIRNTFPVWRSKLNSTLLFQSQVCFFSSFARNLIKLISLPLMTQLIPQDLLGA